MGYETIFNLEIGQPEIEIKDVAKALCEITGDDDQPYWTSVLEGDNPSKWYDYTQIMHQVSLRHPDTIFTLRGEGEKSDDRWVAYFKGGKVQEEHMPEWVPPLFDSAKLQDPE